MGCHSIEACRYLLYDPAKGKENIRPVEVEAYTATLKWSRPAYMEKLREATKGFVDYSEASAEDYARTIVMFEDEEGREAVAESTNAWSFVGPGLRLTFEVFGLEYYMQVFPNVPVGDRLVG